MMFGQLSNRESLRNLVLAAQAHANKVFHLGFGKAPPRATCQKLITIETVIFSRSLPTGLWPRPRNVERSRYSNSEACMLLTQIRLTMPQCLWLALFRTKKGGIKLHTLHDIETRIPTFFQTTRYKSNGYHPIWYEKSSFYIFDRA